MNLRNLSCQSGFMLSEVLITMLIVSIALTPALANLGILRFLNNESTRLRITFYNKNILAEQTFKAKEDKKLALSFVEGDKKTGAVFKYVRGPVAKGTPPFKKFDAKQIKNLCKQEAITTYKKITGRSIGFLYKPSRGS